MRVGGTRVGVVGVGYWGINHVRTFAQLPQAVVTHVCDENSSARQRALAFAPAARATGEFEEVLADHEVDAVVLATPAATHAELAIAALEAGKHVLVEKPLALRLADAVRVSNAARASGLVAMVGHLMVYHPAVQRLKELLATGELGDLYYLYASRVNLGRLRRDENALWSFAPHDLSMIDFLLAEWPASVVAVGQSYLQPGIEDVVFLTVRFPSGALANIHLSWLDPHKERRLTLVGSRKMAVFDDVASEKLRIYDKGYDRPPAFTQFGEYLAIRHGDIHIPHLTMREPLAVQCGHFIECIGSGSTPMTSLSDAVSMIAVLEAAQQSLETGGSVVSVARV